MADWSYLIIAGSIYVLGFVGLFAITLLPVRAFLLLRRNSHIWRASASGKAAMLLVLFAGVAAISFSAFFVIGVFHCLTDSYCGPSRFHGWYYLAYIGVCYIGFEALSSTTLVVARKYFGVAT